MAHVEEEHDLVGQRAARHPQDEVRHDGGPDRPPQRLAHAAVVLGAVVVAKDGLGGDGEAQHNEEEQRDDLVDRTDGRQAAVGADDVGGAEVGDLQVEHRRCERRGHLHAERRQADSRDAANHRAVETDELAAEAELGLAAQKVRQHKHGGHGLTDDGGDGRTHHTHAHHHDEQVICKRRDNRTGKRHGKRGVGRAVGADEVRDSQADGLDGEARQDDGAELVGVLAVGVGGTQEVERGREEQLGDNREREGHHDEHEQRDRHGAVGFLDLALAQAKGRDGVAAHAEPRGEGTREHHEREGDRGGRNAGVTHAVTHEEGVNKVVDGAHHHREDGGRGEFEQQARDGCRPKRVGVGRCAGDAYSCRLLLISHG